MIINSSGLCGGSAELMRLLERLNVSFLYLSVWLLVVMCIAAEQLADPDLWGRLSIAALYFQNGQFPYHDVFSYTAPHAKWVDHEWLTGFIFYGLFAGLGETGFVVFKYLILLATLGGVFWLHRKVYKVSSLYAFYGFLALISFYSFGYHATLRSHVFSFLGFSVFIALLEAVRLGKMQSKKLLWLLPLSVFWANCHGGFIVGLLLIGLYGLGEALTQRRWKPLIQASGLAIAAALLIAILNPYGWDYWQFLFHAWTLSRAYISEWNSINVAKTTFASTQALIALVAVGILGRWWVELRQPNSKQALITPTLILLFLLVMVMRAIRMQTFLALGLVAYLPVFLSPDFLQKVLPKQMQNIFKSSKNILQNLIPRLVLVGSLIGLCVLHQSQLLFKIPMGDELTQGSNWGHYPVGAVRYLKESPYSGNLLIRFGLGEFAYWCLFPRFKVSMDGRYEEVYSQQTFLDNYWTLQKDRVWQAPQSFQLLNRGKADFILLNDKLPVVSLLIHSKDWEILYQDPKFLIFGRKASLKRFPRYTPQQKMTTDNLTIQDFITPADLARFRLTRS